VDTLLRKYLWVVDLLAIGVCAIFLGRAAASVFESKYLMSLPLPKPAARPVVAERDTVYSKAIEDVIKRNIFCSTCPPLIPGPETVVKNEQLEPVKTTLPLQLMAVNYVAPPWGLEYASCSLRDTETKYVGAFRTGETVRGAKIIGIDETRVHLDNAGKPEFIDLLEPEAPAAGAAPAPAPVAAATPPAGDAFSAELDRGIKKTGENSYEIQRSTLESVLGNMSLLARSARIVPEMRDGKAAGFRLYSVRSDGPFAKIGMQNGDVLSAINGLEITSPEKALEVYAKLKSASHLSLGVERNGQRVTKEYSIR
jgi:general secretion pathway protein C